MAPEPCALADVELPDNVIYSIAADIRVYIYIYIYICVCVCVCVYIYIYMYAGVLILSILLR